MTRRAEENLDQWEIADDGQYRGLGQPARAGLYRKITVRVAGRPGRTR